MTPSARIAGYRGSLEAEGDAALLACYACDHHRAEEALAVERRDAIAAAHHRVRAELNARAARAHALRVVWYKDAIEAITLGREPAPFSAREAVPC